MGLKGGEKITDIKIDRAFVGSCTNDVSRTCARWRAWPTARPSTPTSGDDRAGLSLVKEQAEAEGLDKIFVKAGFECASRLLHVPWP